MDDGLSIPERFRRFWLSGRGPDHALSEEERESTPPDSVIGELADLAPDRLGGGEPDG